MAAVAYIGNHASIFVISIIDDRGMVYNQSEEIEGEKVILWLTNVGGKTGNIKYLGWCEEKDRRDILFNGIFLAYILLTMKISMTSLPKNLKK